MIVVEDRKGYNLSDKALEQRRSAANKKRVSCFMRRLEEKLKFHMDDYLRIQEISTMLTQSFTFDDIVELYRSEYDDVVTKKDECIEDLQSQIQQLEGVVEGLQKQITSDTGKQDILLRKPKEKTKRLNQLGNYLKQQKHRKHRSSGNRSHDQSHDDCSSTSTFF